MKPTKTFSTITTNVMSTSTCNKVAIARPRVSRQLISKLLVGVFVFLGMGGESWGQTNPSAQSIPYSQNFGTTTFTSMPTGMAAWSGLSDNFHLPSVPAFVLAD